MKLGSIRQSVLINATPLEVYKAYADPKKHAAFTGSAATGNTRKGGEFSAWDGYITGKYVQFVRGKKIVQSWVTTEWPEGYPPSKLELRFRPRGKKTQLTMIHTRVPATEVKKYTEGWIESYWEPLKKYFEKSM